MNNQLVFEKDMHNPTHSTVDCIRELYDNKVITSLYIEGCNIGNDGAIIISNLLLHNTTITHLTIKNDDIGVDGIIALGKMIGLTTTLIHLDLEGISICSPMQPIIDGLRTNQSIESLNLSNNFIYTLNFVSLSNILKTNNILKKLYLASTVSYEGFDGIRSLLFVLSKYNKTLIELDLSNNCLYDDIIVNELQETLLSNTSLQLITLDKNDIGSEGFIPFIISNTVKN